MRRKRLKRKAASIPGSGKARRLNCLELAGWSTLALFFSAFLYIGVIAVAVSPQLQSAFRAARAPTLTLTPTGAPARLAAEAGGQIALSTTAAPPSPTSTETTGPVPATAAESGAGAEAGATTTSGTAGGAGTASPTVDGQTAAHTATGTPTASASPSATATPTVTGTPSATPTSTLPPGWSFAGLRSVPGPEGLNLHVYGDAVNNTGSEQEVSFITGIFRDAAGQVIADETKTIDFWPTEVVPPGGRLPFELIVTGIQSAASMELKVLSDPSSSGVRQDFEFANLTQGLEGNNYCVEGHLRNPGGALQDHLVVIATLFDAQGNVINFDFFDAPDPAAVTGGAALDFAVCVPPPNSDPARYELRAWGR